MKRKTRIPDGLALPRFTTPKSPLKTGLPSTLTTADSAQLASDAVSLGGRGVNLGRLVPRKPRGLRLEATSG
eukprot:6430980-Lingulodinium_polyedra.AAC.1